jgi:hypothetical protein
MPEKIMVHAKADKQLSPGYTSDAIQGISAFFKRSHRVTVPLTVDGILDEDIARKLA